MKIVPIAVAVIASLLSPPEHALAQSMPDLICRGTQKVYIRHFDLTTSTFPTTDVYRFAAGKLYRSSSDREEYLYGAVNQVEPGRYVSGHKTIHFAGYGTDFRNAIAVHTNESDTEVLNLRCTTP
jgi:hypothetical protein